jgi:hypothetical protein
MSAPFNPNKQGWGFALVVCLITAGLFLTAHTIHTRTYRNPRNPMFEQVYHDRDIAKAREEGHAQQEAKGLPEAAPPATEKH